MLAIIISRSGAKNYRDVHTTPVYLHNPIISEPWVAAILHFPDFSEFLTSFAKGQKKKSTLMGLGVGSEVFVGAGGSLGGQREA